LEELARDLIVKTQQVEVLIDSLPGIGISESEQMKKVNELEVTSQQVEEERLQALREKQELLNKCDDLILKVSQEKVEIV
jgi:mediator of RNA polymerase II transcription subunit 21